MLFTRNGMVITPDGGTLIVAESFRGRLTAFDIDEAGDLDKRRIGAQLPGGVVPDGICLDERGGVWIASPTSNECLRLEAGGAITDRVGVDQGGFACMLGGANGKPLYILTAPGSHPRDEVARFLAGSHD